MDTTFSQIILGAMRWYYRFLLVSHGVPLDPSKRTVAQQQTAVAAAWVVTSEVSVQSDVAQGALEGSN